MCVVWLRTLLGRRKVAPEEATAHIGLAEGVMKLSIFSTFLSMSIGGRVGVISDLSKSLWTWEWRSWRIPNMICFGLRFQSRRAAVSFRVRWFGWFLTHRHGRLGVRADRGRIRHRERRHLLGTGRPKPGPEPRRRARSETRDY